MQDETAAKTETHLDARFGADGVMKKPHAG
jgi:delta-aminolevulinic acid dehydratase/porphobilinogen synthase